MSLSSSVSFTVAEASTESASVTETVMPAVGYSSSGRGRLVHPTLGTYDYVNTPDRTVNLDGDVMYSPAWLHSQTLTGSADTLWTGKVQDPIVTEVWHNGDVGSTIAHLRALWLVHANPPDPDAGSYVTWSPNYVSSRTWNVAVVAVRAGGQDVSLDRRLLSFGYASGPVELVLRIISEVVA